MQIFLTLRSLCSGFKPVRVAQKGFTLVEIVIVVSIIAIISAIIIPRYYMFDSTTLLNAAAYDVAATLRQAQVYSLSVRGDTNFFNYPFGVSFNTEDVASDPDHNVTNYILFQYRIDNDTLIPEYDLVNTQDILVTEFEQSIQIHDLCVQVSGTEECNGIDRLDISFRRPEFEALFTIDGSSVIPNNQIEAAIIKLKSTRGDNVWTVRVGLFGDISVLKEQP